MIDYYDEVEEDLGEYQDATDAYARIDLPHLADPGDSAWFKQAACLDSGLDFFDGFAKAEAKAICATCPVITDCLDFALRNGEKWGVWGGLDDIERKALLKARA
jgi:WhiB family redox-sensing transcriptional regulator